jgi:small subunit ribosomal protein S8
MPASRLKEQIARVLKEEGFILDYQVGQIAANEQGGEEFRALTGPERPAKAILRVYLKYGLEGEKVIRKIERASKPGLRIYRHYSDLRPVLDGLGIAILSTSRGVMSDRQARAQKVGGEMLCTVW